MPKPDPALLEPGRYPFHCEIETRYRDLDSNLHVNNGVMASLLEEGRVRFHRASTIGHTVEDMTSMVVSLGVEFLGQSHFPEPLEMHVGISHVGRTSYRLDQLVTQQGRVVTYAQAVLVCVREDSPAQLPQVYRDAAAAWMLRP